MNALDWGLAADAVTAIDAAEVADASSVKYAAASTEPSAHVARTRQLLEEHSYTLLEPSYAAGLGLPLAFRKELEPSFSIRISFKHLCKYFIYDFNR